MAVETGRALRLACQAYGVEPVLVTRLQEDVYRVDYASGALALKITDMKPERIQFLWSLQDWLFRQGFERLAPPLYTLAGQPYVQIGSLTFIATGWVEGKKCRFSKESHLTAAARVLGEFHQKASQLKPSGDGGGKAMWQRWPRVWEKRWQELQEFRDLVRKRDLLTPFDRLFLNSVNDYLRQGEQAITMLQGSAYRSLASWSARERTFIHRDVAARNFLIDAEGRGWLIDFDYARYDLHIADVARLLDRSMRRYHWKFNQARLILAAYNQARSLNREEIEVLQAFLLFPQRYWRLVNRYYREKRDWSQNDFLLRMEDLLRQRGEKHYFLAEFGRYFGLRSYRGGGVA
ncbi:CotS family spore coat protein [Carboxydocella sp. JDF658]|uniref:CotS family spore coat protein n=1 Tax=Carboxydocella sp. JDF658 TaxID=1926600 RepID=UPI0009C65F45|nr:CotS family spore coat protein [Carboxydocella sp. JDF658]GAW30574.1 spore coat protein S [Carboxydocella sp. JDF658]